MLTIMKMARIIAADNDRECVDSVYPAMQEILGLTSDEIYKKIRGELSTRMNLFGQIDEQVLSNAERVAMKLESDNITLLQMVVDSFHMVEYQDPPCWQSGKALLRTLAERSQNGSAE